MAEERLQKVLAAAGLGSRRKCEGLITAGRVTVDGVRVTQLGAKGDPEAQEIRCDGEIVRPAKKRYYLLNKPRGYVCTNAKDAGRPRVVDLLRHGPGRLFTVGRLDADTEGLIILTNDGSFAQRVSHPRHGVTKTYVAEVVGRVLPQTRVRLTKGVWISGQRARAVYVRVRKRASRRSVVEIVMREGRKREVRRMLTRVGHPVEKLQRIAIGDLRDATLAPGQYRPLDGKEIAALLGGAAP